MRWHLRAMLHKCNAHRAICARLACASTDSLALDYTLCELTSFEVVLRTMLVFRRAATEQLCLPLWKASFPTRLRCVICAAVRFANCDVSRSKSLCLRTKIKTRHARMSMPYFWRRKRDLNSRAGKPDLHP